MSDKKEPEEITEDKIKELQKKAAEKRVESCKQAVDAALKNHRCGLNIAMVATTSGNEFQVSIVPLD